jgi:predicted DNA-binding ribbon-helix-helix protein
MNQIELETMSPDKSQQVTVTLSAKAYDQYKAIADWKGIPLSTLLRQILEREHESPSFASLYRRCASDE